MFSVTCLANLKFSGIHPRSVIRKGVKYSAYPASGLVYVLHTNALRLTMSYKLLILLVIYVVKFLPIRAFIDS